MLFVLNRSHMHISMNNVDYRSVNGVQHRPKVTSIGRRMTCEVFDMFHFCLDVRQMAYPVQSIPSTEPP
jgi:hypothetical protein